METNKTKKSNMTNKKNSDEKLRKKLETLFKNPIQSTSAVIKETVELKSKPSHSENSYGVAGNGKRMDKEKNQNFGSAPPVSKEAVQQKNNRNYEKKQAHKQSNLNANPTQWNENKSKNNADSPQQNGQPSKKNIAPPQPNSRQPKSNDATSQFNGDSTKPTNQKKNNRKQGNVKGTITNTTSQSSNADQHNKNDKAPKQQVSNANKTNLRKRKATQEKHWQKKKFKQHTQIPQQADSNILYCDTDSEYSFTSVHTINSDTVTQTPQQVKLNNSGNQQEYCGSDSEYSFTSVHSNNSDTVPHWNPNRSNNQGGHFSGPTPGFVAGGDFDADFENDCDYSEDYSSDEYENYSDFDEDDYEMDEEEEDSYEYSEDDDDQMNASDYFNSATDDEDYRLPEDVPEDLLIHRGTAQTRNLLPEDDVSFDSDNEESQIIELSQQLLVKTVLQPTAYQREELEKLTVKQFLCKAATIAPKKKTKQPDDDATSNNTDCPQLVPIIDEDGFQLYSKEFDMDSDELDTDSDDSFESYYEECSDQDGSIVSVDVNSKYLQHSEDDDTSDDEKKKRKKRIEMSAVVIEATDMEYITGKNAKCSELQSEDEPDVLPSEKFSNNINTKANGVVVTAKVMTKLREPTPIADKTIVDMAVETATTSQSSPSTTNGGKTPISNNAPTISSRNIFCNAIDSNHVLVLLRDPLYIYGTVKLILIAGSIEIYGQSPCIGEEVEIFSPRGLSTVHIAAKHNKKTTRAQVASELQRLECYFSKLELKNLLDNYKLQENALVILKRNEQRKKLINTFKKYMSENIFPNMNSIQMERPNYASEYLLHCIINTTESVDNAKPLIINPQWMRLPVQSHSKLMLIGGKSVGKSTLLRYLVNRYMTVQQPRILLIDLDIGQPEVFVPQTISATLLTQPLLGPGCFLNQQPDKSYMIGHTNIVLCPHLYMRAVRQLLHHCRAQAQYAQIPWLINTMGYNKGFGAELIAVICEFLQPTDVVQIQSNKEINNYDYLMEPHVVASLPRNIFIGAEFWDATEERESTIFNYKLHIISSAVMQESRYQREWDMSAKDLRYATLLARLSESLVGTAEWLTDCKPLCAPLDSLKVINMLSGEYTREQLLKSIEANLVYLCHKENDDDKTVVSCLGIGVVRAIDYHVNQIYLLPAMPLTLMSTVNCLAIGEMPLPTSLFTNQGPKVKNIAPFVYNTINASASKSIKQIYHRPAEFLGGKHKNLN